MRLVDLTGRQFGQLTVVGRAPPRIPGSGRVSWRCRCSCGRMTVARAQHLARGSTTSCGCTGKKPIVDLSGKRFGHLRVVALGTQEARTHHYRWICVCDCGGFTEAYAYSLQSGNTTACGCQRWKHGEGKPSSVEYRTWNGMIARCENPSGPAWKYYGGRGIRVCGRWRRSYAAFLADMGRRPSLEYSIDRIDNDGNYEPGNCRWATHAQQNANKRQRRKMAPVASEAQA